ADQQFTFPFPCFVHCTLPISKALQGLSPAKCGTEATLNRFWDNGPMLLKAFLVLTLFSGLSPVVSQAADKPANLAQTLDQVSAAYAKLEPQSIRPAEGFIKYDYLIPAGYYKQMWDWDGFFIGSHLAQQGKPQYLKYWVLDFAGAIDEDGYVAGCI